MVEGVFPAVKLSAAKLESGKVGRDRGTSRPQASRRESDLGAYIFPAIQLSAPENRNRLARSLELKSLPRIDAGQCRASIGELVGRESTT